MNLNTPKFDEPREFAEKQKNKGKTWDEIRNFKTKNFESNLEWLQDKVEEGWPEELIESPDTWSRLIELMEEAERESVNQKIIEQKGAESATLGNDIDPDFTIPSSPSSAWQKYKSKLLGSGFPKLTANQIEQECFKTLQFLKIGNVQEQKDIKGLVIGHVQSGKTANMAGLMAMAADWGFNTFIVLSGTIENLRKQTQDRLFKDLNQPGCRQQWHGLPKVKKGMAVPHRTVDKFTNSSNQNNYLTVSLKNNTNLKNLIGWLKEYPSTLASMKILLIDDEADQASINSKKKEDERTAINSNIIKLTKLSAHTMNYVAYTATPYANVLNEAGEGTLYPRTFIRALPLNSSYFGPEVIFGSSRINLEDDYDEVRNLDVLRAIPPEDVEAIKETQAGEEHVTPPDSLINSIAWFLCAAAVRRVQKTTNPASMLIHTSHRQPHHDALAKSIESILSDNQLMDKCEELYKTETKRLSPNAFKEQYPNYDGEPSAYPKWAELEPHINELLKAQLGHIKISEESQPEYQTGLHLCIDNCSYNKTDSEGNFVRLLYPTPEQQKELGYSTAFIIIGGATLSRGLTIEGLVSTYFLRVTKIGDSLMQMGRWFGYRRGYELLPRIWMTTNTMDQFSYLANVEADLRQELKKYESGSSPEDFGPKISSWAPAAFLRLTAANRMQGAVVAEWDFSGVSNETTMFQTDDYTLKHNISKTVEFLENKLATPVPSDGRALVFENVNFDAISEYLKSMVFHPRSRVFKNIKIFIDWFERANKPEEGQKPYRDWNVIVPGLKGLREWEPDDDNDKNVWRVKNKRLVKQTRSRKSSGIQGKTQLTIGSLQITLDQFLDLPEDKQPPKTPPSEEARNKIREDEGLSDTPQLIIYRIDGQGTPKRAGSKPLGIDYDLIGLTLRIPGKRNKNMEVKIQVDTSDAYLPDNLDIDEEGEN